MSGAARGRPAAVPACAVVDEVRHLIASHAGAPCPTLSHMAAALGVNVDVVRAVVDGLRSAGELQVKRPSRGTNCPKRRLRVLIDGQWTRWTGWTVREAYRLAMRADNDHVVAVTAAGRF